MPKGGKDAFLSKVTFRRESDWYSKTKQQLKELKNMATIEERALDYANKLGIDHYSPLFDVWQEDYIVGATEQKAIDIDKACEWIRNNWRNYVYHDRDGEISLGHWESDLRKSMSKEE